MVLLLALRLAQADVVNPEPTNCPQGSIGASSHLGEWCTPDLCTSTTECEDGQTCASRGLCIEEDTTTDSAQERSRTLVLDTCEEQADCREGTCTFLEVCASEGLFGGSDDGGCGGCGVTPAGSPLGGLLGPALGLVLLGLARRGR